jgi:phospholipid transport system transporter-binding protein
MSDRRRGRREEEMIVALPKELTVAGATALKALLLSVIDGEGPLVLEARAVAEVDVAGLQVLCAAGCSAWARGRSALLVGRSPALDRAVATAGFGQGEDERWLAEEADHA